MYNVCVCPMWNTSVLQLVAFPKLKVTLLLSRLLNDREMVFGNRVLKKMSGSTRETIIET